MQINVVKTVSMDEIQREASDKYNSVNLDKVARKMMKPEGLFFKLIEIHDKDTMKWVLIKFLKETLEFLSESEDARKTQRGKLIEKWIDDNLPNLPGQFDNPKDQSVGFGIF